MSEKIDGFKVFAVTGVNTISFAIDATAAAKKGLLGFAVERFDPAENERYPMPGFKVFRSVIPNPMPHLQVSTADHPIQSFLWDDFTAKPNRVYEYSFLPLRGTPKHLDRSAKPVTIKVKTEPLYTKDDHDVFFNRGVASSQAYERKFGNLKPDKLPEAKRKEALAWLTRDLAPAMLKFIASAGPNDTLLCCFYEFHYDPVVEALAKAASRVRELKIIIDAKDNSYTEKNGTFHESFPRSENLEAIRRAGIPASCIIERDKNPSDIQHNKFMVLLKGAAKTPTDVWTGSTNVSPGGITGQTNVGHWVRDRAVAERFRAYWELVAENHGSAKGDDKGTAAREKKAYRKKVEALAKAPTTWEEIPKGTTAVFSLAFGVNKLFKDSLDDNTPDSHLTFLLLEKRDKPRKGSKAPFVALNARNNVYQAWGSYVRQAVYQWARETNTRFLELNTHVAYIHSKFLLRDPLGDDPIVVTGSANFSPASTNGNDENMIIVRGNQRVADIYLTEFNRLFNHYYARSVTESIPASRSDDEAVLFLKEKPEEWLVKYEPGKLRAKRLKMFTSMKGITTV
jgi:phosphatidylserine/phosphatidylglycerophosphate/cardiolipin synthase-like enzyme